MTSTPEKQSESEQPASTASTASTATAPSKPASRKSILALSVIALGINSTAAVYTMAPSDFALPNISMLADLVPHQKISDLIADLTAAASKDHPSAQQQHVAALQENSSLLQQNAALLQQDSIALASLRQSVVDEQVVVKKISAQITDEHEDVKKISGQISTLIAKVELAEKRTGHRRDCLHLGKARAQPAVPGHAQEAGPAADLCRTCLGWRRSPERPGDHAIPPRLSTASEARAIGPALRTYQKKW